MGITDRGSASVADQLIDLWSAFDDPPHCWEDWSRLLSELAAEVAPPTQLVAIVRFRDDVSGRNLSRPAVSVAGPAVADTRPSDAAARFRKDLYRSLFEASRGRVRSELLLFGRDRDVVTTRPRLMPTAATILDATRFPRGEFWRLCSVDFDHSFEAIRPVDETPRSESLRLLYSATSEKDRLEFGLVPFAGSRAG